MASFDVVEKPREVSHGNQFQVLHGIRNRPLRGASRKRPGEPLELLERHFPGHGVGDKTWIIMNFLTQYTTVPEGNRQSARYLCWKTTGKLIRRMDRHLMQQFLDIAAVDSFRRILLGHHLPVQQRNANQVREAVVCLLLRGYQSLVSLIPSSDNVVSDFEGFEVDLLYLRGSKFLPPSQLQGTLNRRLRVNFRVVFLEN